MPLNDKIYLLGQRNFAARLLQELELFLPDMKREQAALVRERVAAVAALRELCADFGDNEWNDNLPLADIINKHLANYLRRGEE